MFFSAGRQSLLSFDDESRELVAVDFCEHDEDVGKAAVGDEHLFAVKNVMRAVFAQARVRLCRHRVGTRSCFGQRISGDHFAGRDLRQVRALSRFRAKINYWQQADAAFRTQRGGKGSATPNVLTHQRTARLIEPEAAILFGDIGAD